MLKKITCIFTVIILSLIKKSLTFVNNITFTTPSGESFGEESPLLLQNIESYSYFITNKKIYSINFSSYTLSSFYHNISYKQYLQTNPKYVYISIDTLLDYFKFTFFYPRNYIDPLRINFGQIEKQDENFSVPIVNIPQKSRLKNYYFTSASLLYGQLDDVNAITGSSDIYTYFFILNLDQIENSTIIRKNELSSELDCFVNNSDIYCYLFYSNSTLSLYKISHDKYSIDKKNDKVFNDTSPDLKKINDSYCEVNQYIDVIVTTNENKSKVFLAVLGRSKEACLFKFNNTDYEHPAHTKKVNYLLHNWGYNNSRVFIIEKEGENDIYVVFNGGNTIQFFSSELERISIPLLDVANSHIYFYGSNLFYNSDKFILTSTINSTYNKILYIEFDFPKCVDHTYDQSYVDTKILLSQLSDPDQNLSVESSFLYILEPNTKSSDDIKKGEFLCVSVTTSDTKYEDLQNIYYENNFCENIIYHPYKKGSSVYSFYIFNMIQDKLYIPSKKTCTITLDNICYKNCSQCDYVGNEEHQLCTECKNDTIFFKVDRDIEKYSIENKEVGDCILEERDYYYIDRGKYERCYEGCKKCNSSSNATYPICLECAEGYYQKEGEEILLCYDALCLEDYTFELNDGIGICRKKESGCFISCSECDPPGSEQSTLKTPYCVKCASNDALIDYLNRDKVCISYKNKYNYYYESPDFKLCYDTCISCNTFGNEERSNCKECEDPSTNINCTYNKNALSVEIFYETDRDREKMISYLDYNAKVYAMAGGVLIPSSRSTTESSNETDAYYIECYYSEFGYNYSIEYNKLNITKCENYLRNKASDSQIKEASFIICKLDYKNTKHLVTRQTEYSLYADVLPPDSEDYDEVNVTKLNLTECKVNNIKAEIYYIYFDEQKKYLFDDAFKLSLKNITIFDYDDKFFQDQCFIVTHDEHSDLSLRHRVEHFFQDVELCEENCRFLRLNNKTRRIECECDIKDEINLQNNDIRVSLNHNLQLKDYSSFKYIFEFGYYKCLKLVTISGLFMNQGAWIYLFIMVGYFITASYIVLYEFIYIRSRFEGLYRSFKGKNYYYKNNIKEAEKKYIVENDIHFLNGFVFFLQNEDDDENEEEEEEEEDRGKITQMIKLGANKKVIDERDNVEDEKEKNDDYEEVDLFEISNKYNLYKRNRYNDYNYYLALKNDKRKCCQIITSIFKEKHIIFRCLYRESIMEFFGYNFSFIIFYVGEIFYLNVLGMTPDFINERYLGKGQSPYMNTIKKVFVIYFIAHYILDRVGSVKRFGAFYEHTIKAANNSEKFLIQSKSILSAIKKKIITTLIFQFILLSFYAYSSILFCFTFPSLKGEWIYDSLITIGTHIVLNFISSILIGSIRMCGIKEESYFSYNLSLYLKEFL